MSKKQIPIYRTCFAKEIITDFAIPMSYKKNTDVIIFCPGMPMTPITRPLLEFFSKEGYWMFYPRYRGTWESKGSFLQKSPEKDIKDIIDNLHSFKSIGSTKNDKGKQYQLFPRRIILFAFSFGGSAGLLLSRDPRVTKIIGLSPVVGWQQIGKVEPLPWMYEYLKKAFPSAYRINKNNWKKLGTSFYNPSLQEEKIESKKILIFHGKKDVSVPYDATKKFTEKNNIKFISIAYEGHLHSISFSLPFYWNRIEKFINQ